MTVLFARAADARAAAAEIVDDPPRPTPADCARTQLRNARGAWDPAVAPMMAEPLNELASRRYQGICLVGPQRSSKTFGLILAGVNYIVTQAPGDTLVVQMSGEAARDFSRGDLDTTIRHSPELAARLSPRPRDDNTFDKWFTSGIVLKIGWPAVSQLSSKTLRYVFLTDYDRPENKDNVDGEGPLWDLAFRRTLTFMSRGKCLAESSPGEDCVDMDWRPSTPHEGPPARGIVSIYNRGTRARWYWRCLHCADYFQVTPGFDVFGLPLFEQLEQEVVERDIEDMVAQYARVPCPHCGAIHVQHDKFALNLNGRWLHEGEQIVDGRVEGARVNTNIWSGWLGGPAGSYQRWDSMLRNYFQAMQTYARTRDESPLRLATTSDGGAVYFPQNLRNKNTAAALYQRVEPYMKHTLPAGVRFLTAAVDVQAFRFVVQVQGWGELMQTWLIDRFEITSSLRPEGDRTAALRPDAYLEDWDLLAPVLDRTYTFEGSTRSLGIRLMLCDSGGKDGVTMRAYDFWRKMRRLNKATRFQLVKGDGRPTSPRLLRTWPDARTRTPGKRGAARGDVPVWMVNTNIIKDGIANDLAREEPGPGFVHFPEWMLKEMPGVFDEFVSEVRTPKGWVHTNTRVPTEGLDLLVYNRAAAIILKAEHIDWAQPPPWAADHTKTEGPEDEARAVVQPQKAPPPSRWPINSPGGGRSGGWASNWRK